MAPDPRLPGMAPALGRILDRRLGTVQPPVRAEIFGLERFAQHGRSLGKTHRAAPVGRGAGTFFPRLRSNMAVLRDAHHYIGVQASTGYDISPAAEWLLDNFHLIEAQLKEIHEGLPRSYFRALPVLLDEPLSGLPRVYGVAWAFVAHTDSAFDEALLVQFLGAYQEARELNLSELWALPTTLRVVLVENLRRLAERVASNKAAREVANLCGDRLAGQTRDGLDSLLALLQARGVAVVFLGQLARRLADSQPATVPPAWLHDWVRMQWLALALPDLATLQTQQLADQAADNLSVSNAVRSLRAIGDADWPAIVARTSPLMTLMLTLPVFEAEQTVTRDDALHGVEVLARQHGLRELAVAGALVALATAAGPQAVASHWLEGAGRPALLQALAVRESAWRTSRCWLRRHLTPLYLGSLALGTAALVAWLALRSGAGPASGGSMPGLVAAVVLMLLPASEAVVAVVNRLISESAQPRRLPRLALAQGIPPGHGVLVVVPAMLVSAAGTQALVRRLLLHHLANPEPEAQFALLTDWADAATPQTPGDGTLLDDARQQLRALNSQYPQAGAPRFVLLHRQRQFSESEQRWIGWERKRGKLEQLVAALATGDATAFMALGADSQLTPGLRYIVTLDSDTQLPPGRLRELVGVAAHPANQPVLDPTGRRVVQGYAVLQPHVATPLPAVAEVTPFHWLFAGQCGIDPYSAASSEIYQDLFGEGTFTGKGLLQVQALHAVLSGRLPAGRVLSHDLLEGALARCAALSDVAVIEDAPFHADVAASRVHRWTRGDWQLLPFLLSPRRYPLHPIHRWKMFDNLRRSLVAPMSLALLLAALAGWGLTPGAALLLVGAAFTAGPLMGALASFVPGRRDMAKRHFFAQAMRHLARAAGGGLWHGTLLLHNAMLQADAIVRALYRMGISHRHLLQWTTAAAAQAQARSGLPALLRQHWRTPALAVLLLSGLWAAATPWPGLALLLCGLWAASPLLIGWASRPHPAREDARPSLAQRAYFERIARDTWRLFERCVGPEDHHLPPDNLQTSPHDIVAHRTSPTNIGLYLLSVACARQFGWIDTAALLARVEATLATLHRLQRHRGHFLNWYDTRTLEPLLPMYVSTVDSGNLSGHLLATAQACLGLAHESRTADAALRLGVLARELEALAWAPEFGFLYHPRRNLLHIGYRVAEQQRDTGFYDLLASESRLTSLLAIAKGDVPVRHWAALGRPFYAVGTRAGLRSWSGSMFEYLMPTLVLDEPQGSALFDACQAALLEQMAFARDLQVPWGMSESAHAGSDHSLAYQYGPQGVPRLALRRTPPDELVVAPYATALAAQIAPRRAGLNFNVLDALGARGRYGFIEALDYSPARRPDDRAFAPVNTYMAHHQGMTIVALTNVLHNRIVQRWGMANAHLEAVSPLLHERPPREVSLLHAPPAGPPPQALQRRAPGLQRDVSPGGPALAPTHVLSNGHYSVTLRPNGAGTSQLGLQGLTRSRDDALRDAHGSFFYLRWPAAAAGSGQPHLASLTLHPAPDPQAQYQCSFHLDRVCFDAGWPGLQAHMTVWVSPEDDIEFREVELRNLTDEPLEIELMSAFEVTMAEPRADEAHPAFSSLFVSAAWDAVHHALRFTRKPRLATEQGLHMAHFLADSRAQVLDIQVQTDRQQWLGRNRPASQPLAGLAAVPVAAPDGVASVLDTGLDPVCALALRLRIVPRAKARLTFATAAADHDVRLRAVVDKYRQASHVQRASLMSATLAGIRLRALRVSPADFAAIQLLTSALVQVLARPRADAGSATALPAGVCDRRQLWRFGLSGDRPILLVMAGVTQGLGLLRSLAQALQLWAWGGVACDLVVVNTEPASYHATLQRDIQALRERHGGDSRTAGAATVTAFHVLRADELSAAELDTLQALACARLAADGRPLALQVRDWAGLHEQAGEARSLVPAHAVPAWPGEEEPAQAPQGTFEEASGEFQFTVDTRLRPARPWINVLANPHFGAQISEAGGGYTWAGNSRLNQLTAWSNDPVADPPAEWFLLQDLRTHQVWSVTPSTWGDARVPYQVRHGQGYTTVSHRRGELEVTVTWCVDPISAVKQVQLRLLNQGARPLHLRAVGMAEWMMGARRADRATTGTTAVAAAGAQGAVTALLCTQRERSAGFGGSTAFLALAGGATTDWTGDRRECFDDRGRLVLPERFAQATGTGLDPCAALATSLQLRGGEAREVVFLLGHADSPDAARALVATASGVPAAQRLAHSTAAWDRLLGATAVKTPDPLFDAMVNRWLLYQTVSCRLWARAGFYQAGGAYGFRDQLQDAMALAWAAPDMLRAQIVLGASRQFAEGDVQHWWHAPGGAGVRTHFSDDLLWLPHACVRYLGATGDLALLDEAVTFIEGPPIADGAEDAYYAPGISMAQASIYEHAARAIDHSLRVGAHGLPLMGTGDWNDGMNRVGAEGRGESVWLGWFLCQLVTDFVPYARARGDDARALRWLDAARGWQAALAGPAWDGHWYRRAFFDNGEPLGTHRNPEARIDLIAQAWAVLSNAAPAQRQREAMGAVLAELVDDQAGLIRLLTPPLANALPSAGYIQAYPPGVRENGGQYSHAGVWALMAQARLAGTLATGRERSAAADLAWRYFTLLSPAHRASHPVQGLVYGIEPYVMAGDVYSQAPWAGRGGWSWYTGAAAWLHRAAVESIFGLEQQAQTLAFRPCLPSHWPRAELTLMRDGRRLRFLLVRVGEPALASAMAPDATLLMPGEALRWAGLPADTFHVIPLVTTAD